MLEATSGLKEQNGSALNKGYNYTANAGSIFLCS